MIIFWLNYYSQILFFNLHHYLQNQWCQRSICLQSGNNQLTNNILLFFSHSWLFSEVGKKNLLYKTLLSKSKSRKRLLRRWVCDTLQMSRRCWSCYTTKGPITDSLVLTSTQELLSGTKNKLTVPSAHHVPNQRLLFREFI